MTGLENSGEHWEKTGDMRFAPRLSKGAHTGHHETVCQRRSALSRKTIGYVLAREHIHHGAGPAPLTETKVTPIGRARLSEHGAPSECESRPQRPLAEVERTRALAFAGPRSNCSLSYRREFVPNQEITKWGVSGQAEITVSESVIGSYWKVLVPERGQPPLGQTWKPKRRRCKPSFWPPWPALPARMVPRATADDSRWTIIWPNFLPNFSAQLGGACEGRVVRTARRKWKPPDNRAGGLILGNGAHACRTGSLPMSRERAGQGRPGRGKRIKVHAGMKSVAFWFKPPVGCRERRSLIGSLRSTSRLASMSVAGGLAASRHGPRGRPIVRASAVE